MTLKYNQIVSFKVTVDSDFHMSGEGIVKGTLVPYTSLENFYVVEPYKFENPSMAIPNNKYPFEYFCVGESNLTVLNLT